VEAIGLADVTPANAQKSVEGRAIVPLAPVHGEMRRLGDGSLHANWIRRSRIDLGWRDGVDQVLVEQSEAYLVDLLANGALITQWTIASNQFDVSADALAALNIAPGTQLSLRVAQIGRFAQSAALAIALSE
jgi:hypothetical protein